MSLDVGKVKPIHNTLADDYKMLDSFELVSDGMVGSPGQGSGTLHEMQMEYCEIVHTT